MSLKWGASLVLVCLATAIDLNAQTFTTLVNFDGTNGGNPLGKLVQGLDGNLYGTTSSDGAHFFGTVFKITPAGTLTTLHSFDVADGETPQAGLILATDGNFYGTTSYGGAYVGSGGTVFKLTAAGKVTTLYSFCAQTGCPDGAQSVAELVQAANRNLFGTTFNGGAYQDGTVFQITLSGTVTTYGFDGGDGWSPEGALVQGSNGDFYGTTIGGGGNLTCPTSPGCGVVFKMTPSGMLTALYNFCAQANCTDGSFPSAGLVQATNGSFYGTTSHGGTSNCHGGCGTIFEITPSGTLKTLYAFNRADGASPSSGVVQATDGNFYGTTLSGGTSTNCDGGCGTIFKLTSSGVLTVLHNFDGTEGFQPKKGLIQATDGTFYGTTYGGGTRGDGTVFRLSVGLSPFIKTIPTSCKVGSKVIILGNNLTGATSVTFNATPVASFTVNKTGSAISTTVPTGATTGTVQVVTPSGTLSSNVVFRVR